MATPDTMSITVIDFETTGSVPGYANEPWQVGLVAVNAGRVCMETAFDSLLRVGYRPFNRYAPGRHAQLRDDLCVAPSLADLWGVISERVGYRAVAAHNIATEKGILAAAFPLHPFGPWIDTLTLCRRLYPGLASYALDDLTRVLGLAPRVAALCPGREPHDALYDAVAAAVLLEHAFAHDKTRD
ncbi:MAG: exonuclease domain-containing protein [Kiritimatiellaeota bacterium]|nr:exonuclease domain-containing protein [Kiritimatiellota bacterium]